MNELTNTLKPLLCSHLIRVYDTTQKGPLTKSPLDSYLSRLFTHKWAVWVRVQAHSERNSVAHSRTHTLGLFSSPVTDNAQCWWRHLRPSLYCPTQGPWNQQLPHTQGRNGPRCRALHQLYCTKSVYLSSLEKSAQLCPTSGWKPR